MCRLPDLKQVLPCDCSFEGVGHDSQVHQRVAHVCTGISLFKPFPDRGGSYIHPLSCAGFSSDLFHDEPGVVAFPLHRCEHQATAAGPESHHLQRPVCDGAVEPTGFEGNVSLIRVRYAKEVGLATFALHDTAHGLNSSFE